MSRRLLIEMNHRLEKAAHWYRLKRFGFIPEPEYRAGISTITVVKVSLASCMTATEHERTFQLTPNFSTRRITLTVEQRSYTVGRQEVKRLRYYLGADRFCLDYMSERFSCTFASRAISRMVAP